MNVLEYKERCGSDWIYGNELCFVRMRQQSADYIARLIRRIDYGEGQSTPSCFAI